MYNDEMNLSIPKGSSLRMFPHDSHSVT